MATLIEVRRPAELIRHGIIAGVVAGITLVAEERLATVLFFVGHGRPPRPAPAGPRGALAAGAQVRLGAVSQMGAARCCWS